MKTLFLSLLLLFPAMALANLKIVPHKEVCMVNDTHFSKAQIPVEVNGKTYYGCCQMCKKTLSEDAATRTATDPVTKKNVDKATAVIAAREDGSVLYFENNENLKKFKPN